MKWILELVTALEELDAEEYETHKLCLIALAEEKHSERLMKLMYDIFSFVESRRPKYIECKS